MNIRKNIFLFSDFLKGKPVMNEVHKVKRINESSDLQFIENYQSERMNILLEYSINNTKFYGKINSNILENFPVIDKSILKNSMNQFISTSHNISKLQKVTTSGSTGTPFVSYRNTLKTRRNTADTIYFAQLAGYEVGEPLFYLKIWSDNNRKSNITQFLQNIVPIDVIELSSKNVKLLIDKMRSKIVPIHINGYSSALEEVCKYLKINASSIKSSGVKVSSIIAQSEALNKQTKEFLYQHFDCLPCSRYSNVENGIIAQQTKKDNDIFKINRASYVVEILKINANAPADHGELGRIVITDLFNFSMPFIRYDTGDIGKFFVDSNGDLDTNFLTEIQGRKLDLLLNTKGEIISSYIMYKNMFSYPEIDQYQLIQQSERSYQFIISIRENFKREEILKKEFLSYLGSDAQFEIKYVEEIPLLSSGKRRKIVNNYLKNKIE